MVWVCQKLQLIAISKPITNPHANPNQYRQCQNKCQKSNYQNKNSPPSETIAFKPTNNKNPITCYLTVYTGQSHTYTVRFVRSWHNTSLWVPSGPRVFCGPQSVEQAEQAESKWPFDVLTKFFSPVLLLVCRRSSPCKTLPCTLWL